MNKATEIFLAGLIIGLSFSFFVFSPTMKFLCKLNGSGVAMTTWERTDYYYSCGAHLDAWLWDWDSETNIKTFDPKIYRYN